MSQLKVIFVAIESRYSLIGTKSGEELPLKYPNHICIQILSLKLDRHKDVV